MLEIYADVAFRKLVSSSDVHYDRYVLVTLFPFFPSRPDDVELFLLVTHFFPNVSIHFVFTLTFKFKFTKKKKRKEILLLLADWVSHFHGKQMDLALTFAPTQVVCTSEGATAQLDHKHGVRKDSMTVNVSQQPTNRSGIGLYLSDWQSVRGQHLGSMWG